MNSKILQIALSIVLIEEEFSEQEILEAVNLLKEQGVSSHLLTYFSAKNSTKSSPKVSSRNKINSPIQKSQVSTELETKEPEKYKLLTELESSLRNGDVLSELSEIRKLGEHLNKGFLAKNSRTTRTNLINNLLNLLVSMPTEDIENIINNMIKSSDNKDDYQQLAEFIIEGQTSQNKEGE